MDINRVFDEDNDVVNLAEKVNVKEENAIITIKTYYLSNDEEDSTDIMTKGIYRTKGSLKQIIYQDTEATGFENCDTKITVRGDDFVTILRHGYNNGSDLIMQCEKKFYSQYRTPMGTICLGIMASEVDSTLDESGGNLHMKYTIDSNGSLVSENEVTITVTLID